MGVVYKHTNTINGKYYVGKTTNTVEQRLREHLSDANRGSSFYFHKAIRKYGIDAFTTSILEECSSEDELNVAEMFWIEKLQANFLRHKNGLGYNMTDGGEGNTGPMLEAHRAKISATMNTEEYHAKHSAAMKAIWDDEEYRAKHSAARKTEEYRAKISVANSKTFKVTNIITGEELIVTNLSKFCRERGLNPGHMSSVANGKCKHHKGWLCRYPDVIAL